MVRLYHNSTAGMDEVAEGRLPSVVVGRPIMADARTLTSEQIKTLTPTEAHEALIELSEAEDWQAHRDTVEALELLVLESL